MKEKLIGIIEQIANFSKYVLFAALSALVLGMFITSCRTVIKNAPKPLAVLTAICVICLIILILAWGVLELCL